ncbi:family 43 glycosylhydrolase [Microbacterium sp.]|uniref:family 43 glycosylhydrolase n=1 Tax=Microbacterium sp. TaxID=51671 RepID=UPI003F7175A5
MTAAELYRDPVYDGATDPLVVIADDGWWMFYTQRRATHPDPGPGVAWVHGSRVGVARSTDGIAWAYAGTLEPDAAGLALRAGPPPVEVDRTHWAPEVVHDGVQWRMYLTEIDGVPDRWPGFAREIVEYRSTDLRSWQRIGALRLSSDRVIDACVARTPDGRWRLWYKDEAAESVTMVASSDDLDGWLVEGIAIGGRAHEGPCAFELAGVWWMVVDEWRGMAVYRSDDAQVWTRQGDRDAVILGEGSVPCPGFGHHGAAVRDGDAVWFYYFGHPEKGVGAGEIEDRRCAVHRTRLTVESGVLTPG